MEIKVSQKTKKTAKEFGLSPERLAFADLLAVGWPADDAYAATIRTGVSTWTQKALSEEISRLEKSDEVQNRIQDVRNVLTIRQKEAVQKASKSERSSIIANAMSKEQMLFDLQTALNGMKTGSKEWLDTKKMIIDVTRMKQDEVQQDDNTIHYFLPVQYPTGCQDCLYQRCDACKYKKEYNEK